MKTSGIILLASLLVCGCSQKQTTAVKDFVHAGRDISCDGGSFILHVTKRDGNSLFGIRCVSNPGTKSESDVTADTGSIELIGTKNGHWVEITLNNPKDQTTGKPIGGDMQIALHQ